MPDVLTIPCTCRRCDHEHERMSVSHQPSCPSYDPERPFGDESGPLAICPACGSLRFGYHGTICEGYSDGTQGLAHPNRRKCLGCGREFELEQLYSHGDNA